jgi:cobalt/nickel transport protein
MSTRRPSPKVFFAAFLLVSLVVAGVVSFYASSHPDGLEYVAEETGFIDEAEDSPMTSSPLNDYSTSGIDDPRVSSGVAGVLGVGITLAAGTALFWVLRRRGVHADDDADASEPAGRH